MIFFVCLEMKRMRCRHKNIEFTIEKESNKFLSFLDILIKNEGNCFSTSLYRKKTSIGLSAQFYSFTPVSYKIGLTRCLIHRAFKITSSYIIFHNKLENIKILLQKNMYPKSVIDNQIKTFLDKQFTVDSVTTSEKQKTLHYSLPYIGHFSHVTKKKLRHIFKDTDIKILFSLLKLSSFFSCKDTLPKYLHQLLIKTYISVSSKPSKIYAEIYNNLSSIYNIWAPIKKGKYSKLLKSAMFKCHTGIFNN